MNPVYARGTYVQVEVEDIMNKLIDMNQTITLGILFALTIAFAIIGIVAEIAFITNHLELIARQISLVSIGGFAN